MTVPVYDFTTSVCWSTKSLRAWNSRLPIATSLAVCVRRQRALSFVRLSGPVQDPGRWTVYGSRYLSYPVCYHEALSDHPIQGPRISPYSPHLRHAGSRIPCHRGRSKGTWQSLNPPFSIAGDLFMRSWGSLPCAVASRKTQAYLCIARC